MQRKVLPFLATFSALIVLAGCGGSGSFTGGPGGGSGIGTGTGTVNLSFGLPVGANAITTDFTSSVVNGRQNTSALGTQLVVMSSDGTSIPSRTILVTLLDAAAPAVGTTYVIGGSNPNTLVYTELVSTTETRQWGADGGQVRVTAIDGDKVTLAVEAAMSAGGPTSTGTFNVSGTVVVDRVERT